VLTKTFVFDPDVPSHSMVQWLGYEEEFWITVTNTGTSASGPVTITDILDPLFQNAVVSLDSGNGSCAMVAQALSCNIPTLAVGETRTIYVAYGLTYTTDLVGSIVNCATATDSTGKATSVCSTLNYIRGPQ
jgi:uncharacterized repeat protein (TIGR01451 family)